LLYVQPSLDAAEHGEAMDAIETLMNEHRTIERVIDALVAFTADARLRGTTDREELARFVGFLTGFADSLHHGKEEDVLFAAMARHGFPTEGGPIAVMLAEHARGRAFIQVLAAAAEGDAPWTDADRRRIAEAAAGYGLLLRSHIHKEDAILYPMAEQHLPPPALEAVGEACDRFDAEPGHSALHAHLLGVAAALVARHVPSVHPQEIHP
jgi:hemerythrin-like domain-containing protein